MSRNKGRDTAPELAVRSALHHRGWRFRKNLASLPGRPDIVFVSKRLAVFIDGDFWHGYRFTSWSSKLSPYWREKISQNRLRDTKNNRRLRTMGWHVLRLWEHEVDNDLDACVSRIEHVLAARDHLLFNRASTARAKST